MKYTITLTENTINSLKRLIDSRESQYLTNYPDVKDAVAKGWFTSGYDHYTKHGKTENRVYDAVIIEEKPLQDLYAYLGKLLNKTIDFDEAFYLRTYPDVKDAVTKGWFTSGYDHYIKHGKAEGRKPKASLIPPPEPVAITWAPANEYGDKDALIKDMSEHNFDHKVQIDGVVVFNENGFGPALRYTFVNNKLTRFN